ncbi:MAG: translation elongation factor Ts, partial [Nitrospirae bacterium]
SAGCIVEVNSETDFVAKNETFRAFAAKVAQQILETDPADVAALLAQPFEDGRPLEAHVKEQIATLGENLSVRRFARFGGEGRRVASYIHMQGKIGVLVELEGPGAAKAAELGRDIAMHIAASNPAYLQRADVPEADIDHERQIFAAQARESGKPEQVIDKIVTGRLEKFFAASCLLEQPFVKDTDVTVHELLARSAEALGGPVTVTRFARFALGEGLEKRSDDFAAEVAAQLK